MNFTEGGGCGCKKTKWEIQISAWQMDVVHLIWTKISMYILRNPKIKDDGLLSKVQN